MANKVKKMRKRGKEARVAIRSLETLAKEHNSLLPKGVVTELPSSSPEYEMLERYIVLSKGEREIEVKQIFTVERQDEIERFREDLGNRFLVLHGTALGAIGGILSVGLRIFEEAQNGSRHGRGLYFADSSEKAAKYCHPVASGDACIFVAEVAMGFMKVDAGEDDGNEPKGFDSKLALGRFFPKKKEMLPHLEVTVPMGPMVMDESRKHRAHNEYIVYKADQVRLRYLVHAKIRPTLLAP